LTADRAEWTGFGAALLFHVALIAAMSMSLAHVTRQPEPPSMEVELVGEVGIQAAAPTATPPPPAAEPPAMPTEAVPPPLPAPSIAPLPLQRAVTQPSARPAPSVPRPAQRPPAQPSRRQGLDDDFLKSFDDNLAPRPGPAQPAAARFDARAKASVAALFQRRVQPCANQQINPGDGANRIRVTVNLRLRPNGTLAGTPQIVRVSGVDDENSRFEERVKDLAVAVYRECSPFSGLPPELYKTPEGGWSNINLTYKLP
jgi:hypothetical protein